MIQGQVDQLKGPAGSEGGHGWEIPVDTKTLCVSGMAPGHV